MTSSQHRHDHELPLSRLPHIPRPRDHEPALSYLTRLAAANATTVDRLTRLLGTSKQPPSPGRALHLNQLAAQRMATLTGRSIASLQRAIPTLIDPDMPNDRPQVRCRQSPPSLRDCPRCQLRRGGAARRADADYHQFLCLRHGAWLQHNDLNDLLDLDALPETAAAYRRLHRLRRRFGPAPAVGAFRLAGTLLTEWDYRYGKYRWATQLHTRWFRRATRLGHPGLRHYQYPSRWPNWMMLPERVALAAMLIQPHWARRALPSPTRTHRDF